MNLGSATIKKLTGVKQSAQVLLPKSFLNEAKTIKKISFGKLTQPCSVGASSNEAIQLTEDIYEALYIPEECHVQLFVKDNTLHIGPLVGIFTAGFTGSSLRPIGERSLLFAKYLSAGQYTGTIPFVFGVHHIDWEKKLINGFFYSKTGWVEKTVPFPNVIYDRLPNRKSEAFHIIKKAKDVLQNRLQIPWYNPGFFDKWTLHKLAQNSTTFKKNFPQTILSPKLEDIEKILDKFGTCYLKPVNGSLGYGIFQLLKRKDSYYCRYRNNFGNRLRRFQSLKKLIEIQFKKRDLTTYICQQGIDLLSYENSPYDFRVHTNKNSEGKWELSALALKTAGSGSVTTHLRFGGQVKTVSEVLIPSMLAENVTKRLTDFSLALSHFIEEQMDGIICEIGYDIGIDVNGDIWVFEANSKPGRSIFTHPKLKEQELKTRTLPFDFASYLLEESLKKKDKVRSKQP